MIGHRRPADLLAEERPDRLAAGPARRIDDGRAGVLLEGPRQHGELVGFAAGLDDRVSEVRPVEAGDELRRVLKVELVGDVAADEVGGRGRQGDARGKPDRSPRVADPGVIRPEVVAPLADAVGLVDGEQGRLDPRHRLDEPMAPEPLGGDVDEVIPPRLDLDQPGPLLLGVERAIEQRRAEAPADEDVDLIFHQGDQGADDQGEAVEQERRKLVAEALAAAGRHDAEDVATAEDLRDHLALAGPEPLEAEPLAQGAFQVGRRFRDTHGRRALRSVRRPPDYTTEQVRTRPRAIPRSRVGSRPGLAPRRGFGEPAGLDTPPQAV